MSSLTLHLAAWISLLPATLLAWRGRSARPTAFWLLIAVAVAGSVALLIAVNRPAWRTDFATSLWFTILACLIAFVAVALAMRSSARLAPLLLPYLCLVGALAIVWHGAAGQAVTTAAPTSWLAVHIGVSLATYALLTLAAVAGFAMLIQERALKNKRRDGIAMLLPSVSDCERLEFRLLAWAELVLGVGLATGMAMAYLSTGKLLPVDHKVILSLAAFAVIGLLLVAHRFAGLRGRRATRWVLSAYLLLTLAYPGVKFVSEVLLGRV